MARQLSGAYASTSSGPGGGGGAAAHSGRGRGAAGGGRGGNRKAPARQGEEGVAASLAVLSEFPVAQRLHVMFLEAADSHRLNSNIIRCVPRVVNGEQQTLGGSFLLLTKAFLAVSESMAVFSSLNKGGRVAPFGMSVTGGESLLLQGES